MEILRKINGNKILSSTNKFEDNAINIGTIEKRNYSWEKYIGDKLVGINTDKFSKTQASVNLKTLGTVVNFYSIDFCRDSNVNPINSNDKDYNNKNEKSTTIAVGVEVKGNGHEIVSWSGLSDGEVSAVFRKQTESSSLNYVENMLKAEEKINDLKPLNADKILLGVVALEYVKDNFLDMQRKNEVEIQFFNALNKVLYGKEVDFQKLVDDVFGKGQVNLEAILEENIELELNRKARLTEKTIDRQVRLKKIKDGFAKIFAPVIKLNQNILEKNLIKKKYILEKRVTKETLKRSVKKEKFDKNQRKESGNTKLIKESENF